MAYQKNMAGTRLNGATAALPEYGTAIERREEKARRSLRINKKIQKNDSRAQRILSCHKQKPGMGYFSDISRYGPGALVRGSLLHSGAHIQYPGNSKWPALLKRDTNRAVRRYRDDIPRKGNFYRRFVERWDYADY